MKEFDYVIIGGGCAGLSLAYELEIYKKLQNNISSFKDDIEQEIDTMNDPIEPLKTFILPGGSQLAAHLHVCRTVARRAERLAVELASHDHVNPEATKYLNRLSDWFFVASRAANNNGSDDLKWVPGANR